MTPCPSGPAWADAEPGSGFFFASNARMGRWAPPGAAIFHVAASELSCAGMVRTTEPAQEPETKNLKLGSKMDPRITKSSMNPLRLATNRKYTTTLGTDSLRRAGLSPRWPGGRPKRREGQTLFRTGPDLPNPLRSAPITYIRNHISHLTRSDLKKSPITVSQLLGSAKDAECYN